MTIDALLTAVVGGLIGAIVPVTLGGIAFAVAWGKQAQEVKTLGREMGERKQWETQHLNLHLKAQGD